MVRPHPHSSEFCRMKFALSAGLRANFRDEAQRNSGTRSRTTPTYRIRRPHESDSYAGSKALGSSFLETGAGQSAHFHLSHSDPLAGACRTDFVSAAALENTGPRGGAGVAGRAGHDRLLSPSSIAPHV